MTLDMSGIRKLFLHTGLSFFILVSMYGKHFESMYTGSMIGIGAEVFAVWGYVIANRRKDLVELNPKLLAFLLGEPEDEVVRAIERLCSPDPKSRTKIEGGRRLIKEGEYVYRVVNASRYDEEAGEYERRERDKFRKREERAGKRSTENNGSDQPEPDLVTGLLPNPKTNQI